MYLYSFQFHIHTQFSYDSLGKVEDIKRAKEECGIDYVVVSDHRNMEVFTHAPDDFVVGVEKRVEEGDIIDLGEVKVIAHPFNPKYEWKGKVEEETPLEVVNIKDVLKENKLGLILLALSYVLFYPLLKNKLPYYLRRLINIERYAKKIIKNNWFVKAVGGLDHHVKFYYVDSKKKFLLPDYSFSFKILRNYILSRKTVRNREDLIRNLKEEKTFLVFDEKPFMLWKEDNRIKIYSPKNNIVWFIKPYEGKKIYCCEGNTSPFFKIYFGIMPYFIGSSLEV